MPCAVGKVAVPGPQELQKTACPQPSLVKEGQALGLECRGKGRGYGTADAAHGPIL